MDVIVHGPFAYRRKAGVMMKGESTGGHTHNFTHTTILYSGAVHVRCTLPDGTTQEGDFKAYPERGEYPKMVIFAENRHDFTALEDGTFMECWYVHRDDAGQVMEKWAGNLQGVC